VRQVRQFNSITSDWFHLILMVPLTHVRTSFDSSVIWWYHFQ